MKNKILPIILNTLFILGVVIFFLASKSDIKWLTILFSLSGLIVILAGQIFFYKKNQKESNKHKQ